MKRTLLLFSFLIAISFGLQAQNNARTYAITGKANNSFFWADVKQIDLTTGKVIKTLFEANKSTFKLTNADNKTDAAIATANPTGFGVAACALDVAHNRLYFAPIHFSDISYLDLNSAEPSFTSAKTGLVARPAGGNFQSEENQITRMAIGADGYGYALTNDANHLFRFSTGKNVIVDDLGALIDAAENKGMSIHNKCSSWGGDMVADAFGKLVIVTASHNIFDVDVVEKTATFKGSITGLPANFSTNGAAVDDNGNMVVSSANVFEGLFTVNMKNLTAIKANSTEAAFNASDLANGNFLLQREADDARNFQLIKNTSALTGNGKIFPNPLTGENFRVAMPGQTPGNYTIVITDLAGRTLQSKVVNLTKQPQTISVAFAQRQPKGTYIVSVLNSKKQVTSKDKLVVE